MLFSGIFNN